MNYDFRCATMLNFTLHLERVNFRKFSFSQEQNITGFLLRQMELHKFLSKKKASPRGIRLMF